MTIEDKLLFPLFDELRRHGVPLGVPEYLAVIKTVRSGIGLDNPDQLKRLCRLL